MRFLRLPLTDPEAKATYTHVRGVTGHHGVLMVGQYTCDPERWGVFLNHFTGILHTKLGVRSRLGWGDTGYLIDTSINW